MQRQILFDVFLRLSLLCCSHCLSIGLISNSSLTIFNSTVEWMNGSLQQCLCRLVENDEFSSFNYFSSTNSCEMHLKSGLNNSFTLITSRNSNLHFLLLPVERIESTTTSTTTSTRPSIYTDLFWSFDGTYNDETNTLNGIPLNGVTFSLSSITGFNSSLSVNRNLQQGLVFPSPFLNLFNRSWTFELWFYLTSISNSFNNTIIAQCLSPSFMSCFHVFIRNSKLYIGFFGDDLSGNEVLIARNWYHVAFVFNCSTRQRQIYLDGYIDNSNVASSCYQGLDGNLTVGFFQNSLSNSFSGLIDRLSFSTRAKTADEILDDATLTFYCSFDNETTDDQGSLQLDAIRFGSTNFTDGRVGKALYISDRSSSYLQLRNLVLLGTLDHAYTISLWIKPYQIQAASIIYLLGDNRPFGTWCLTLVGILSTGAVEAYSWTGWQLNKMTGPVVPINKWTHVAVTYSRTTGGFLYVNGTMYDSFVPSTYAAPGIPNFLFVGSSSVSFICLTTSSVGGQFDGAVDEFRLYSRALTAAEIYRLANP